jgi:hypothetical protein
VNLIPIASFLAGSLLTLLIPAIMLTLLVVWYTLFIRRVPETTKGEKPGLPDPAILPDAAAPESSSTAPAGPTSP